MQSVIPPGDPEHTVIAGKAQGYLGLAINYTTVEDTNFPGEQFAAMITAWQPTPDELTAMNAGAPIIVQIMGIPPIRPMCLFVGEVPNND